MIANYHTHTYRCHHANGFEWQYVEQALDQGLQILGFSDHIPNPFEHFSHLGVRMRCRQLPEYIKTIHQLRHQFGDRLTIHCGLEAEYSPIRFPRQLELLDRWPGVEYLLLGQHFTINADGTIRPVDDPTDDEAVLANYVDLILEGLQTGKFLYLCHPDIIHFTGDPAVYRRQMTRLCRGAVALNIPLELNGQGLRRGRIYPNPAFWAIAAREGCLAVVGADAHAPDKTADPEECNTLQQMARHYGLTLLETLEDRL